MPRRKILLDDFFDILSVLTVSYFSAMLFLWFTNKDTFWKWLLYGIVFFSIIIIIAIWRRKIRFKRVRRFSSDRELLLRLRAMKPKKFEVYIADLFSKLGYKTEVVGGSYDRGVDVIAKKDGLKYYIQCKKYITSTVGVGEVRDFYGAIADHLTQAKGYFITTNKFTLEAERFAEDKPIELIDGQKLIKYIRLTEKETKPVVEKLKKCPQCDGNLIERKGKFGKFYGCSNYPKCRFTKKINGV